MGHAGRQEGFRPKPQAQQHWSILRQTDNDSAYHKHGDVLSSGLDDDSHEAHNSRDEDGVLPTETIRKPLHDEAREEVTYPCCRIIKADRRGRRGKDVICLSFGGRCGAEDT